jgi:hypothetical protein
MWELGSVTGGASPSKRRDSGVIAAREGVMPSPGISLVEKQCRADEVLSSALQPDYRVT